MGGYQTVLHNLLLDFNINNIQHLVIIFVGIYANQLMFVRSEPSSRSHHVTCLTFQLPESLARLQKSLNV